MRLALISGGSAGLGLALCRQYQALGYRLVDFSRSGGHPFSVRVDLADPVASLPVLRHTLEGLAASPWDEIVLVNNAGTLAPIGPASRKSEAELMANMNLNFCSAILLMSTTIRAFQAQACRKRIGNISSGAATKGYAGWSLYCAAKAGVENFIRALAREQEAEAHPFEAININPGVMDTAMQAAIRQADEADFPDVRNFVQRQARGELQPPERIAGAVRRILELPRLEPGRAYSAADHLV